jgi:hydrogenase maturation protein HypF
VNGEKFLEVEVGGIVQGVGFRPFVYRLARSLGLRGWVGNNPEGVFIRVAGGERELTSFLEALREEAPPAAVVEEIRAREVPPFSASSFRIVSSSGEGEKGVLISPDLATCGDCLRELFDPADRRYRYPFINCTNCGPRFTIIRDIPYDRPLTTMAEFEMCEECRREYEDPGDRRFHAQPNACPRCGPRLWLTDADGKPVPGDPVREAARLLRKGAIVALKGLGGFQLSCDATSDQAVERLRKRKRRYAKPLAVMVRDVEEVSRCCRVGREESLLLTSPRSPIVLLEERKDSPLSRRVAPGLKRQGIFLPYTPLHHLLLRETGIPLVMTSGNLSEEPIARDNDEALRRLGGIADYFLLHDRDILVRYDDSVTSVLRGREYPLRRARGYAPYPVILRRRHGVEVLALGGELKNTFCFLRGRHAFLGQHVGDMDNAETLAHFREAMQAVRRLFSLRPVLVAHDMHPDYLTTSLAEEFPIPRCAVQHHHAHVASCMAEQGLEEEEVIGVAWDGTGYGRDGTVWGGEFLVGGMLSLHRRARLSLFPMPGGEVCITRIHRMAMGALLEAYDPEEARELFARRWPGKEEEAEILAAQAALGVNTPLTSSAGRLFDAVAALIGVRDLSLYEGQAACELEAAAGEPVHESYPWELARKEGVWEVDTRPLVRAVVEDWREGVDPERIAGKFHATLARALADTCAVLREETGIDKVVLSGGVFQNRLLTLEALDELEKRGFACYVHRRVPCNDGGISLGQAVVASRAWEEGREEAEGFSLGKGVSRPGGEAVMAEEKGRRD